MCLPHSWVFVYKDFLLTNSSFTFIPGFTLVLINFACEIMLTAFVFISRFAVSKDFTMFCFKPSVSLAYLYLSKSINHVSVLLIILLSSKQYVIAQSTATTSSFTQSVSTQLTSTDISISTTTQPQQVVGTLDSQFDPTFFARNRSIVDYNKFNTVDPIFILSN